MATTTAFKLDTKTDITTVSATDFGKFTVAEVGTLNKVQAQALSAEQIATLTDKTVPGIFGQLKVIDAGLIGQFSKAAIPLLPIANLTTDQVAALTLEQFKVLTPAQVGALNKVQLACIC